TLAIKNRAQMLEALNPAAILRRGYAIVRQGGRPVRGIKALSAGGIVDVQISDGAFTAAVSKVKGR
ncbi:MAG: exodeoxyribonuclease VII large subunit, partial [Candidatus Binatota bacterium]|nr:exodeoxyribonuclease VII large subunit [Candidatus Binatota bacterium]